MALAIRRNHPLASRLTLTVVAMFALVAQPLYGLIAAEIANAATVYTEAPFTSTEVSSNWSVDRALPSGGHGSVSFAARSDVLEMNINKDAANMSGSGFYQTEGLKRNTGSSTAIKADLYVDSDWIVAGKTVRAGLWGTGKDAGDSISAYPIVEFTTDGYTGWRFYNTVTGEWTNSAAPYISNGWNTLEIKLDEAADKITYHVNNVEIGSASAEGSTVLAEAIINSKNYGASSKSYSAHWSQFGIGTFTVDPPGTPSNLRLNGDKACGFVTNINYITPTWDAVADVASYNYKVELPNGSVYGPTNVGNVTNLSGAFGGEGISKFSVQAVGSSGLTSDWAPMCAVTYDQTAPEMPAHETPVNNAVQNSNDFWFDWSDVTGATSYEMQNSTDPTIDGQGSFQNVMWTGDYQQIQPTESRARSVGANGTWYWQVRAVDAAGNKSAWTTPWKVTIDKNAPDAPMLSAIDLSSGDATSDSSMTAVWTKPSDDTVKYEYQYWNDIEGNPYKESTPWSTEVFGESRSGSFTEGEGTHYLRVRAVDYAGNASGWSNIFVVTYDKTAPAVPATNLTQDTNNAGVPEGGSTNSKFFTFALSSSGDTTRYQLKYWNDIAGSPFKADTPWNPTDLSGYSSSLGVYEDQFTQGEGTHYFSFSACDAAGNCSAYGAPFVVVYDVTPPVLTLNSLANNPGTSRTISGTSDPFATIEVTVHSTPQTKSTVADVSGNWSLLFEGLELGSHTVKVVSTDAIGNISEQLGSFTVLVQASAAQVFTPIPTFAVTPTVQPFSQGFATSSYSTEAATESDDTVVLNDTDTNTNADSAVLSAQDDETGTSLEDTEVLGTTDNAFFGIVWYWWLVALAVLVGAWLLIAAAVRRSRNQDSSSL